MSTSEPTNEARLRAAWSAAWDRGDVTPLHELLAAQYQRRSAAGASPQNREEFEASILTTRRAFPDLRTTIDELITEDNRMAIRWHSSGTHTASFLGVPATERTVEVFGVTFSHFEKNAIIEEWVTWDPRQLLSALGIIALGDAN